MNYFIYFTSFLIVFTCSCQSVNDCKFRWFKAFKRESSNLLLNRKWPEVLKSRTSNPVSADPPGPRRLREQEAPGTRISSLKTVPQSQSPHSHASSWPITGFALLVFHCNTLYTLETNRELVPKCVPQLFLGSLVGTRRSAIGHFSQVLSNSPRSLCDR